MTTEYWYKKTKINLEQDYIGSWRATTENYQCDCEDGAWVPNEPAGEGLNQQDAVDDLIEQLIESGEYE